MSELTNYNAAIYVRLSKVYKENGPSFQQNMIDMLQTV